MVDNYHVNLTSLKCVYVYKCIYTSVYIYSIDSLSCETSGSTGLKREATNCETLNGHAKEEVEVYVPSPPSRPGVTVHLTPFELEGLRNLLGKLESLPSHKTCVPAGIHNAPALLHDIRVSPERR